MNTEPNYPRAYFAVRDYVDHGLGDAERAYTEAYGELAERIQYAALSNLLWADANRAAFRDLQDIVDRASHKNQHHNAWGDVRHWVARRIERADLLHGSTAKVEQLRELYQLQAYVTISNDLDILENQEG